MDIHRHIFLLSGFENTFFSFHLRFSPYPVTTTIIWPTSDRIPHFLIFKRMQIKRIADNIRQLFFQLTNWNKEPDEQKIYGWTKFLTCKLDNNKWKNAHWCTCKRTKVYIYISIYISLCMKTFLKTGVYIYTLVFKTVFIERDI